ncbi:DUF2501 domain-containing protein [Pseudorhodoferax sp.]|uniref:DUF2501 domain-containing protein n=1 Tax=Pseudorhodoferax sp. TaxID=1993553 RepID=UPI0039E4E34C
MMDRVLRTALAAVLAAASATHAAGLMDSLKGAATEQLGGGSGGGSSLLGNLGLPSIGSGTASNAAGVLQYCVERKYLSGGAAGVKDALLNKIGLSGGKEQQDAGYQSGLSGLLSGSDGKSFDLNKIQDQIKDKACDYVLDNAKSLL